MLPATLQTISVMIAAASVVIGVTSWRRSYLGQKKIDLAERSVELFAKVRDAIRVIRSPFGFSDEGSTRKRGPSETDIERDILDRAYVAIERYNKHSEEFSELLSLRHRFAFYFGEDAAAPFDQVNAIRREIFMASQRLSQHWLRQGREQMSAEDFEKHLEEMHKDEAIFWSGYGDSDPIEPRVSAMFDSINETCRRAVDPGIAVAAGLTPLLYTRRSSGAPKSPSPKDLAANHSDSH